MQQCCNDWKFAVVATMNVEMIDLRLSYKIADKLRGIPFAGRLNKYCLVGNNTHGVG